MASFEMARLLELAQYNCLVNEIENLIDQCRQIVQKVNINQLFDHSSHDKNIICLDLVLSEYFEKMNNLQTLILESCKTVVTD